MKHTTPQHETESTFTQTLALASVKSESHSLSRGLDMSENLTSLVADALFRSGCLKFGSFRIKSGALSPYYIDLAGLLSHPRELHRIAEGTAGKVREIAAGDRVDRLASIELRGALLLPSVAVAADLPCVVVRKEAKAYGITGRIVGEVAKGERILFFDDVVSEGLSKLEGIRPLEEAGALVKDVLVVVDREQDGKRNLENLGYQVHALAKVSELVDSLHKAGNVTREQADAVTNYIKKS